jgi:hypothetical protein
MLGEQIFFWLQVMGFVSPVGAVLMSRRTMRSVGDVHTQIPYNSHALHSNDTTDQNHPLCTLEHKELISVSHPSY